MFRESSFSCRSLVIAVVRSMFSSLSQLEFLIAFLGRRRFRV
jgi:hypothetical protein